MTNEVAKFVCGDCKASYYAEIIERNGGFEIGQRVTPEDGKTYRTQRMLCGDCRGKGGPGDQLQKMIEDQRRMMGGY